MKRIFVVTATKVNMEKLKYLKRSLTSPQTAHEEMIYYQEHIHKIINTLMDVLVTFIFENELNITDTQKFINDRWPSTYQYWINSNQNTALDYDWVLATMRLPTDQRPRNMKHIYKMFVLCNVIRSEVCHLPKENHFNLPQFKSMFAQLTI